MEEKCLEVEVDWRGVVRDVEHDDDGDDGFLG